MSSVIRHQWVEAALAEFRGHFWQCGFTVPDNIRVSVGFTKSPAHRKTLGQCIDKGWSKDGHYELFISPEEITINGEQLIDKPLTINILETIAHELIHATVGNEHGHQGAFIGCAAAVGFNRPWRYTPAGEKMLKKIEEIIAKLGLFPAGTVMMMRKKTQGKSLIKCQCEGCDFTAYVTRKQLEANGTPICPNDFEAMLCE